MEIFFVNAAKYSQEITQSGTNTFIRIGMDFPDAVTIVIASIFFVGMADCSIK